MRERTLLEIDGVGNVLLGLLLLLFPARLIEWIGVPGAESAFYPSLFGAVLVGIGIALLIERFGAPGRPGGLGLGGALAINFCFGAALVVWLLTMELDMAARGRVVLWLLAAILLGISGVELAALRRPAATSPE